MMEQWIRELMAYREAVMELVDRALGREVFPMNAKLITYAQ